MPVLAESRRIAWRTEFNEQLENASSNDSAVKNKGLIVVMRQVCEHRNHGKYMHNVGNTFRE